MKHEMKLQPKYYDYMTNGTKRVEIRLFDEKRKNIKIGDTIKFLKEPTLKESFDTRVVDLLKFKSFDEMFKNIDMSLLSNKSMTKKELKEELETFYPREKQEKYGVIGIKIELI